LRQEENRFIPTPVGNTQGKFRKEASSTVHPHACGEHVTPCERSSSETGSSPRLWGTRTHGIFRIFVKRFIPTPVGNTQAHSRGSVPRPVHPHACGEHSFADQWSPS